jgi:hypothetical protein
VSRDELLKALAVMTALEYPSVAREAVQLLPEFIEVIDVLRAEDGVQQLARALDAATRERVA